MCTLPRYLIDGSGYSILFLYKIPWPNNRKQRQVQYALARTLHVVAMVTDSARTLGAAAVVFVARLAQCVVEVVAQLARRACSGASQQLLH